LKEAPQYIADLESRLKYAEQCIAQQAAENRGLRNELGKAQQETEWARNDARRWRGQAYRP
jgi:hypothetical protein